MVTQKRDGMVEFRFFRPNASCITVAGDFNGWHQTNLPMRKGGDGWWRYRLRLAPGYYQFRYIVDGQWYTDYAAFGVEHGPFGLNSVVKVEAPVTDAAKPAAAVKFAHISQTQEFQFDDAAADRSSQSSELPVSSDREQRIEQEQEEELLEPALV